MCLMFSRSAYLAHFRFICCCTALIVGLSIGTTAVAADQSTKERIRVSVVDQWDTDVEV